MRAAIDETLRDAMYGAAAESAQSLSEVYAQLAAIALTEEIKTTWKMAAEVASDWAAKARERQEH
jgi:hypothetical protein